MNRWAIVAIPLMFCLVLMDAVVRQFLADRAFSRGRRLVEEYEMQHALYMRGKADRPAPVTSAGPLLKKAVKLEGRCAECRNYLGRYYQSLATAPSLSDAQRMHLARQAIEQYEKAVRFDPLNGTYLAYLAYIQGVMGEHEKAVTHFEQAIQLDRSNKWIQRMYDVYLEGVPPPRESPEPSENRES